ncbi:MAG: UDP-N-acetyl-D-mannosamine dehydrogenase [Candidatus Argoarchaeum ethanivorans]|uniref:UDP-N-acetyl-D-mannosamine dehydrogenase n=1 Tax=Candidatus Argoarchaeum ethanivorans TaxID=2608793 RepID=A0A811TBW2_9EURY|nr:MAG: UDP-N-acetyl-D-mannosamine dehydrogenase [Candidatus Argoarchaeum ethanivorans]
MRIAVIGLGKAGLPLAGVIAERGFDVIGVDIDERRCEAINSGENPIPEETGLGDLIRNRGGKELFATTRYEGARKCNVFIIIVPLFIDEDRNPDFRILEGAFRSVGKILKKHDVVVLETTVPPMTTEKLARMWLEEASGLSLESGEFYLAHSPERIMTGFSISRLKKFPKIVGGVNRESGVKAFDVYKEFIPSLHMVSSAKVAEFVKVIEGCYRDVNIALANELFKIANEINIDFLEARKYANHEYCNIHLPSTGVGGHCIPLYPWFLIKEMEKREKYDYSTLLRTSRVLNDQMINYWAEKIVLACMKIKKPLADIEICISGITFRDGVKELYHSRNLALAKALMDKGLNVQVSDELFTRDEIEGMGLKFGNAKEADIVFDSFKLEITTKGGI